MRKYDGFFVVELVPLLLDVLAILLDLKLLLPALEGIRVQKLAVESPDLFGALEELVVGNSELDFFFLKLEASFFLIDFPAFELLLLELSKPLILLPFLEVLGVVDPLVSTLLALHMLVGCQVVLSFYVLIGIIRLGMTFALIFILTSSS